MVPSFVPIKIEAVFDSEIGMPRNDGSPGGALYSVPIKLSGAPPREWIALFVEAFDNPSERPSMRRPGIARVTGNRLILDGTTIEELDETDKKTISLALAVANREYLAMVAKQRAETADACKPMRHTEKQPAKQQRKSSSIDTSFRGQR
jgi:hypothetical protein